MIVPIPDGYYLTVTYILCAIIGLCVGSFLNVVIYRVPLGMSVAFPASHCPKCGYKLRWYDNIPVLSYVILGGKCRSCKERISFRYTLVEILTAALWLLCAFLFKDNLVYMFCAIITCSVGVCVTFIDLEHMIIPDRFHLIMLPVAVLAVFCDEKYDYVSHLIGFGLAIVVFVGIAWLGEKILKREALGGGDVKLAIVAGLFLGWQKLVLMMLVASVIGSAVMLIKRIKSGESKEIPFAPFLILGLLVAMLFGNAIIDAYMGLII